MIARSLIVRRSLSTERNDIGQIFVKRDVQKFLKDITRFEESRIFARRLVPKLKTPNLMFMTDVQLKVAKDSAYEEAKARLQMPPVMAADTSPPQVISRDDEIVGYTKFKIMFIDIGPGYSDRSRLMSVREPDGTLRFPTHEERSRLNHIFFPSEYRSIDTPKMFEEKNLSRLLKQKQYVFILNRACMQFEPDVPNYIDITTKVYSYIDDIRDYDKLRSTRHFGPMSLFLAYNKRADNIILEMLSKNLVEDAVKLVKVYNMCHNIEYDENEDGMITLKRYVEHHSNNNLRLDSAVKDLENKKSCKDKPKPTD